MDKHSRLVLSFMARQTDAVSTADIQHAVGDAAPRSVEYLQKEGYIQAQYKRHYSPGDGIYKRQCDAYTITAKGISYLEHRPGVVADRWITRICAIVGALTGIPALVLELVRIFRK